MSKRNTRKWNKATEAKRRARERNGTVPGERVIPVKQVQHESESCDYCAVRGCVGDTCNRSDQHDYDSD